MQRNIFLFLVALALPLGAAEAPLAVREVTIRTLAAQMKYDRVEFRVQPGTQLRLKLVNDDDMPHNLVVARPSGDKGLALAQKAWALGEQGMAKQWIPEDPRGVAATGMVAPHAEEVLAFEVPREVGDYPFVCTFPGHAMVMNGVMRVMTEGPKLSEGKFALYLGKWGQLPDFAQLTPLRQGALEDGLIGWKFDDYRNDFGIRFTGKLEVKKEGVHQFFLASDDGTRLSIDGKVLVQNDGVHPPGEYKVGKVGLKPGWHDFQLDYFQGTGGAELFLAWEGPNFSKTWLTRTERKIGEVARQEKAKGLPLVVKDEAVIYRNFIEGMGARGIAVGYPGGVNAGFDADLCSLSLVWRGAFMDAQRHWTDRGSGYQPPLGYGVIALPRNVPLAVLANAQAAWPAMPKDLPNGDWPEGYRFGGYALDKQGIPTFRYSFRDVAVEERLEAAAPTAPGSAALQRVISLKCAHPVEGLFLRLAAGAGLAAGREGVYPLEEGIALHAATATLRQSADQVELLVPIVFQDGAARIAVSYHWNH